MTSGEKSVKLTRIWFMVLQRSRRERERKRERICTCFSFYFLIGGVVN